MIRDIQYSYPYFLLFICRLSFNQDIDCLLNFILPENRLNEQTTDRNMENSINLILSLLSVVCDVYVKGNDLFIITNGQVMPCVNMVIERLFIWRSSRTYSSTDSSESAQYVWAMLQAYLHLSDEYWYSTFPGLSICFFLQPSHTSDSVKSPKSSMMKTTAKTITPFFNVYILQSSPLVFCWNRLFVFKICS